MRRRKVVVRTLEFLDAERKIVNTNEQWKSLSTQRKRMHLLDEIHGWYDKEVKNRHGARSAEPAVNSLREKAPKRNSQRLTWIAVIAAGVIWKIPNLFQWDCLFKK